MFCALNDEVTRRSSASSSSGTRTFSIFIFDFFSSLSSVIYCPLTSHNPPPRHRDPLTPRVRGCIIPFVEQP